MEPDLEAPQRVSGELHGLAQEGAEPALWREPHQKAALYGTFHEHFQQLQGKELSYNNILDITSATYLIGEFEPADRGDPQHTNPCGVASADSLLEAWEKAYATDRQAPFGGVIVINQTMDGALARSSRRFSPRSSSRRG